MRERKKTKNKQQQQQLNVNFKKYMKQKELKPFLT